MPKKNQKKKSKKKNKKKIKIFYYFFLFGGTIKFYFGFGILGMYWGKPRSICSLM